MYQLAKETAQDALQMARRHGFNTELESLRMRIEFLDQLCKDAVCRERIKRLDDGDTSTSASASRIETSCSEPDENQNSRAKVCEHCHSSSVLTNLQMDQTTSAEFEEETKKSQAQQYNSFSCPSNLFQESCMDSHPQTVTAEVEHHTNSITLTVKDCDAVIVGPPVSVPHGQSCALFN